MEKTPDQLFQQHFPLAMKWAGQKACSVPPQVAIEELQNAALIGLWKASAGFDHERGIRFSTFAAFRVKGEMKDFLRSLSRVPRSMVVKPIVYSLSSGVEDEGDYRSLLPVDVPGPVESALLAEAIEIMIGALKEIDQRDAFVLRRYYLESTLMREIAEEMGITEGRVSQIRLQALESMQRELERYS